MPGPLFSCSIPITPPTLVQSGFLTFSPAITMDVPPHCLLIPGSLSGMALFIQQTYRGPTERPALRQTGFYPWHLQVCPHVALSSCSGMSSRSSREKRGKVGPSSNSTCLCLTSIEPIRLEDVLFVFSTRPNTMQKGLFHPPKRMINELMLSWNRQKLQKAVTSNF